jgi:hypothetical protein
MSAGISRDEWLKALEDASDSRLSPDDPSWLSLYEYAAMVGCHYNKARRDLKCLVESGKAERQDRRRRTDDGAIRLVTCYRLVKGKKR